MSKPTPRPRTPVLDYHQMIHFVEDKYSILVRDSGKQRIHQAKAKAEGDKICPDGSWFRAYPKDYTELQQKANDVYVKIMEDEPPYLDYWHWLLDNDFASGMGSLNGSTQYICLEQSPEKPDWVNKINQLIYDEFGEYCEKGKELEVEVCW